MVEEDESPNKDISKINVNQPAHVDKFTKKKTNQPGSPPHSQGPKVGVQMILQHFFWLYPVAVFLFFFCGVVWEDSAV